MKRHKTTARFPLPRWEELQRNAQFMGMTTNGYLNLAVENQNSKYRRQRQAYLQAQEDHVDED